MSLVALYYTFVNHLKTDRFKCFFFMKGLKVVGFLIIKKMINHERTRDNVSGSHTEHELA